MNKISTPHHDKLGQRQTRAKRRLLNKKRGGTVAGQWQKIVISKGYRRRKKS